YAKQMSEKTGLVPPRPTASAYEESEAKAASAASAAGTTPTPAPAKRSADAASSAAKKSGELFSAAIKQQLGVVFGRMTHPVTLALELDGTPLSAELQGFIGEMVALSGGKLNSVAVDAAGLITAVDGASVPISLVVGEPLAVTLPDGTELPTYGSLDDSSRATFDVAGVLPLARPTVRICVPAEGDGKAGRDGNGSLVFTGLAFHGVPSGHEFNSFVLGLYNAAGPGQPLGDDLVERAKSITDPLNIMILVSLTCTMCPETVLASQRIASLSPAVRAEAYDVSHFPELKDQYGAMSVPCIVITQKSIPQMLELVGA
ncbi:MAG: thioredoxin family protein, partial [Bifidobacterium longum]|nr:thioredoxin family protein [Bifidobacterium longum]